MMSMYQSEMQLAKQICRCANVSVMKGTQTMRITSNGKSIANQLTDILNRTLPRQKDTGLSKDLGVVKVDPISKGKSVLFNWHKETFRLSENLKVMQIDFTNTWIENEDTKGVEYLIKQSVVGNAVESILTPEVARAVEPSAPAIA